jgi:hypothetical protein
VTAILTGLSAIFVAVFYEEVAGDILEDALPAILISTKEAEGSSTLATPSEGGVLPAAVPM